MDTVITDICSIYRYKTDRTSFRAKEPVRQVHILSYQEFGWYDHTLDSGILPVKKDMIFFINREDDYYVKRREYDESICVTFKGETSLRTMTVDCSDNPEIRNLFRKMLAVGNARTEYNALTIASIMYGIFAFMEKKREHEYISPDVRGRVIEIHSFLTLNYREYKLNTSELVDRCGISSKYFRKMFKRRFGVSPKNYSKAKK